MKKLLSIVILLLGLGLGQADAELWTPAYVPASANALWLDASDSATVLRSDVYVTNWLDKSGNNRTFSQIVASNQPAYTTNGLNGLSVLSFTNSYLTSTNPASTWRFLHDGTKVHMFSIVKVWTNSDATATNVGVFVLWGSAQLSATTGSYVIVDDRYASGRTNNILHTVFGGTGQSPIQNIKNNTWSNGEYRLLSLYSDPSNSTASNRSIIRANGTIVSQANTLTSAPKTGDPAYTLDIGSVGGGSSARLVGNFAEIVFLTGEINTIDRQQMEGYLAWKWGMQDQLPVAHPYKDAAPTTGQTYASVTGGYWTNAATWGGTNIPVYGAANVFICTGHTVTNTGTNAVMIGSLSITGTLTHAANAGTYAHIVNLSIGGGGLTIDSAGQINVTGKGYNTGGAGNGRYGGSHGGQGGFGVSTTYVLPPYGSITNPVQLGRPGSGTPAGGGAVIISTTGSVSIAGGIYALGSAGDGLQSGAPAGGSINITANSISGTGTISVVGGGSDKGGGSGSGGRIAIITAGTNFGSLVITAKAGEGWSDVYRPAGTYAPVNNGAGGTIYLKKSDDANGSLLVNYEDRTGHARTTFYTNDTYRFDTITLTNQAVFFASTNATLNFIGCVLRTPDSIVLTNSAGVPTNATITSRLVIGTPNSALLCPAAWTNNGCISWIGTNGIAPTCDVTIASRGIWTHEASSPLNKINLNITGSITVDAGGAIWVSDRGASTLGQAASGSRSAGGYGGQGGYGVGSDANKAGTTYDSITNPIIGGSQGAGVRNGGGMVIIKATGFVTNDGWIFAKGQYADNGQGAGSGGGVNLRASSFGGSGTINVDGGPFVGPSDTARDAPGGGGRIAIEVTESVGFGNVAMSAAGGTRSTFGQVSPGAGTIYLRDTSSAYGKLIVPTSGANISLNTLIGPLVTGAVVGDVELQSGAKLAISNGVTLTAYGSWSNAAATNAISGGTVVLAGASQALVWGGNTWSNLTITTAGKVVQFQASSTQHVYGIPAFSNVTLQSTTPGSWWYLRKPGSGTQDVGIVTVQDSNATNGWMFSAATGSIDSGHNYNWLFSGGGVIVIAPWRMWQPNQCFQENQAILNGESPQ